MIEEGGYWEVRVLNMKCNHACTIQYNAIQYNTILHIYASIHLHTPTYTHTHTYIHLHTHTHKTYSSHNLLLYQNIKKTRPFDWFTNRKIYDSRSINTARDFMYITRWCIVHLLVHFWIALSCYHSPLQKISIKVFKL